MKENAEIPVLSAGDNCWRIERATHAALLVDCANYYRALYESICRARKSVFVLGWDIDSRIRLLRGEPATPDAGITFFELIQRQARLHPDLQIYLNRWNHSIFMSNEREGFSKLKWSLHSPPNIHYCLDDMVPMSACHHQKIVIVDDEVAFNGGADVALGRYDHRSHHCKDGKRVDPGGTYTPFSKKVFGPYHDIQCVVAGPAAVAMAELARERWRTATDTDAIPVAPQKGRGVPAAWPKSDPPVLHDIPVGISLTVPAMLGKPETAEIEKLYIDQIAAAENFIYIENQFLTHLGVARAINRRLREKPALRVLMLSCMNPQGVMEKKAMWTGRVHFRDIVEANGVKDRVLITYPIVREDGTEKPVRIHSKVMIVDDRFMRIGSANLNNRSMGLDTECDLTFVGTDEKNRAGIAKIRNDLIREHTGREADDIAALVLKSPGVDVFLDPVAGSTQHLRRIDDEQYRNEKLSRFAIKFVDARKPFVPGEFTMPYHHGGFMQKHSSRVLSGCFGILAFFLLLALAWHATPLGDYLSSDKLSAALASVRQNPFAFPIVIGLFILSALLFLPLTVIVTATAIAFGPAQGFLFSMAGGLIGTLAGFYVGRLLDRKFHGRFVCRLHRISHYIEKGGVMGIAALRMVPVAPSSFINITLGLSSVPVSTYIAGSFLGLLPGVIALSFLGDALAGLWENPTPTAIAYFTAGLAGYVLIVYGAHSFFHHWQKKHLVEKTAL